MGESIEKALRVTEKTIVELEAEIVRSRSAMDAKRAKKSAADALFTFKP